MLGALWHKMVASGKKWSFLARLRSSVVYTGTFQRSLDAKARFLLPKRVRAELAESDSLFLTPGTDHCLELHTNKSLNALAERANHSAAGCRDIKSFSRLFYAQAERCGIDAQGRIRIPKTLFNHATLEKDIFIVGVGFNWEIWDVVKWSSYLQTHEDEFDQVARSTFDHSVKSTDVANQPDETHFRSSTTTNPR